MLMLTPLAVWKHQTKFLGVFLQCKGVPGNLSARLPGPNEDRIALWLIIKAPTGRGCNWANCSAAADCERIQHESWRAGGL
jgi:hypothetical protein